jgi:phosphoglycerate dehydrogenase-like enzyme
MTRPRIAISVPERLRGVFFADMVWSRLLELGEVVTEEEAADFTELVAGASVIVSSWGTPRVDARVLALAPDLRLLAHTGSSVKRYVSDDLWCAGVRVMQAGDPMAESVAETALGLTLSLLQRINRTDHALRSGMGWRETRAMPPRRELRATTVGVVGASRTGRGFIWRARALGAIVQVSDPYLDSAEAERLGVRLVTLDTLMSTSAVVSIHAPSTPETAGMIGAPQLAAMPDHSVLVNTARAALVDGAALMRELRTGRIDAGLDVYDEEPLPAMSELRTLPNVLLSPHVAGNTLQSRHAAGVLIVDGVAAVLSGGTPPGEVFPAMLARMG